MPVSWSTSVGCVHTASTKLLWSRSGVQWRQPCEAPLMTGRFQLQDAFSCPLVCYHGPPMKGHLQYRDMFGCPFIAGSSVAAPHSRSIAAQSLASAEKEGERPLELSGQCPPQLHSAHTHTADPQGRRGEEGGGVSERYACRFRSPMFSQPRSCVTGVVSGLSEDRSNRRSACTLPPL